MKSEEIGVFLFWGRGNGRTPPNTTSQDLPPFYYDTLSLVSRLSITITITSIVYLSAPPLFTIHSFISSSSSPSSSSSGFFFWLLLLLASSSSSGFFYFWLLLLLLLASSTSSSSTSSGFFYFFFSFYVFFYYVTYSVHL